MTKKKRKRAPGGGRKPLPPEERRVRFSCRLPATLLRDFQMICRSRPRGTQAKVVENAIRRFVQQAARGPRGKKRRT